ncbi:Adenosine deaminase domain-containing protein 1 [Labeo rohita]|uniref:Adenosine deaminase domain-containing protein 1 n=1 Tax=Labeo rohita TaxID=84645 RepID=A0ABQ8M4L7_LABRO|nr:Adenosine deaminase domain-containing protein 1 [Labeo rohita]
MLMRGSSSRGSSMAHNRWTNISSPPPFSELNDMNNNNKCLPGQPLSPSTKINSKPKGLPREHIDKYKRGDTHPVSALYQLSQVLQFQLDMKETVTTAGITGFYFAFCAVIDGVQYKTGMGITKKEARAKAAELALEELIASLENDGIPTDVSAGPPPLPVREKDPTVPEIHSGRAVMERKNPIKDQVPNVVRGMFTKLMDSYPEFSGCGGTVAAFVILSPEGCEVVALGTGNSNTKASPAPTGRILHDSHAINSTLEEKSVFQQDQTTKLLSLKNHFTLHLYLSQLPKGAAQIPSQLRLNPLSISAWEVNNQIGLHVVVEGKVFSKFSSSYEQMGSHVVSMSATDKIMQWQVLGFQGALLSHFIEPVYVSSIFIGDGSCSDTRGMEMAVNQRVDGITSALPLYYCVYRPHISLVSSAMPPDAHPSQKSLSLNWSHGDLLSSPALASRLCKAAMLSRFNLVAKEAQREELLTAVTYREAKMMAKPYQEAKSVLKSYLERKGYGQWVEKPPISDHFSM